MSGRLDSEGFESFMAEVCEAVARGIDEARLGLIECGLSEGEAADAIAAFPVDPYIAFIASRAFRAFGGEPPRRETVVRSSLADAMLDLHGQICERWGDHPDTLDDLEIRTLPCSRKDSARPGTALAAYPRSGINKDGSNLLVAYFEAPQPQPIAERSGP